MLSSLLYDGRFLIKPTPTIGFDCLPIVENVAKKKINSPCHGKTSKLINLSISLSKPDCERYVKRFWTFFSLKFNCKYF